jgi:hypothetical protein
MDAAKNHAAKKKRGNLTEDERVQNSEKQFVTKIKLPEQRKTTKKADLEAQKRRLKEQGRFPRSCRELLR